MTLRDQGDQNIDVIGRDIIIETSYNIVLAIKALSETAVTLGDQGDRQNIDITGRDAVIEISYNCVKRLCRVARVCYVIFNFI